MTKALSMYPIVSSDVLVAVAVAIVVAMGCGSDESAPPAGFEGACRSCIGDQPQGPNESQEACDAFAEEYGCQTAELSGSCSDPDLADKAECRVQGCETQPICPTPQ
jgi:hypothetical protein